MNFANFYFVSTIMDLIRWWFSWKKRKIVIDTLIRHCRTIILCTELNLVAENDIRFLHETHNGIILVTKVPVLMSKFKNIVNRLSG